MGMATAPSESSIEVLHNNIRPRGRIKGHVALMLGACLTFARRVKNLRSEYKWRSERYRSRLQLLALSDHDLRDIGISREDAIEEANRDFWD